MKRSLSNGRLLSTIVLALAGGAGGCAEQIVTPPDGPPAVREPSAESVCSIGPSGDADRVVLAFAHGSDVGVVRGDGSRAVIHRFGAALSLSEEMSASVRVFSRGGFIAAVASWYSPGKSLGEAVLFDGTGERIWGSDDPSRDYSHLSLGEGGALAIHFYDADTLMVVTPDGVESSFPGLLPLGAPTSAGLIPVQQGADWPGVLGFFDPEAGEIEPLSYAATATGDFAAIDGGLLYVAAGDGGQVLVRETPSSSHAVDLPGGTCGLNGTSRSGWALVKDLSSWGSSGEQWLANPIAGELTALASPVDVYAFGYDYYDGPAIGESGELFLVARDAFRGGLHRSLDRGATWEIVGDGWSEITDLRYTTVKGTFVLMGTDEPGYFPVDPWEPPPAGVEVDHEGPGVVVARPSAGISRSIDPTAQAVTLRDDGLCVAFATENRLQVMDVLGGASTAVEIVAPDWVGDLVWVR